MVSQLGFNSSSCANTMFCNPYLKDLESVLDNTNNNNNNVLQPGNTLNGDTFSFSGAAPNDPDGLTNCLTEKDTNIATTESGNQYKKTNTGKITGGILGALAPVASRLITKTAFKFKPVAIACTALGLAGAGVGALIDSFTNSKRAEAADQTKAV